MPRKPSLKPRQPSQPSRPRITLRHPGLLGGFGYSDVKTKTARARQAALARAAKVVGWAVIVRRLNVLYVYNKRRHPDTAELFRQDREYASAQLRRQTSRDAGELLGRDAGELLGRDAGELLGRRLSR